MRSPVEALLRAIGFGVWLFVGAAMVGGAARGNGWLVPYAVFGVAFAWATSGAPLLTRRFALAVQSGAALALCYIGLPEFEGALLAVVAAQMPALVAMPIAAAWSAAQAVPLFVVILPSHGRLGSLQATGAYLAFGGFAMGAVYLRHREARARLEMGRLNGDLLATQRLLADSTRLAERLRISRDLHDTIGHHLIALNLQLELEQQRAGESPGPVAEAKKIVHRMLADVREVVGALRKDGGLDVGSAIQALAQSVPEPRVHFELPPKLDRVDPERAHALFRCVQEAITNAVKHGRAQNVWVRVEQTGEAFTVHLRDDGRGVGQIEFGNGLQGMRERLRHLGGELDVSSTPGHGFELRASIPLATGST